MGGFTLSEEQTGARDEGDRKKVGEGTGGVEGGDTV